MKADENRAEWIEAALVSTRGMNRAIPPAGLYDKITGRLTDSGMRRVATAPVRQWAVAAAVLLALNIGSAMYFLKQERQKTGRSSGNPLINEMQLESTYNY